MQTPTPTESARPLAAATPGPWQLQIGTPPVGGRGMKMIVAQAACQKLVAIAGYWPGDDQAEAFANSQLIASAPDLLAALRAALPYLHPDLYEHEAAAAAIANATRAPA